MFVKTWIITSDYKQAKTYWIYKGHWFQATEFHGVLGSLSNLHTSWIPVKAHEPICYLINKKQTNSSHGQPYISDYYSQWKWHPWCNQEMLFLHKTKPHHLEISESCLKVIKL